MKMRVPEFFALASLVLYLTCSANLLTWIGIPYESEGGPFIFKLHPGTLLLILACALTLIRAGLNRPSISELPWGCVTNSVVVSVVGFLLCIVFALAATGSGNLAVILDTFLPASLLLSFLNVQEGRLRYDVRFILQATIFLNAFVALVEVIMQKNIIPLFLRNSAFITETDEFRPTAFYDHPLSGGALTMIGLALAPRANFAKSVYSAVLSAGLLAFGGRASVVLAILSVISYRIIAFTPKAARRLPNALGTALAMGGGLCGMALSVLIALGTGIGQRLTTHLYWDASAQVRVSEWGIIGLLHTSQIMFGVERAQLISLLEVLRIDQGAEVIENFWLLMFISLGAVGFSVFLFAFSTLLCAAWRSTSVRGRILLLAVITAASTSNSLGRRSCLLTISMSAAYALDRRKLNTARTPANLSPRAIAWR